MCDGICFGGVERLDARNAFRVPTVWEVSGIPCVRRVEIQIPMLNRSG
jgi:hypothetical protein